MPVPHRNSSANEASRGRRGRNLRGANLKRAGEHSQRVTLQATRVTGPVTHAALARTTALTAAAIANITKRRPKECTRFAPMRSADEPLSTVACTGQGWILERE